MVSSDTAYCVVLQLNRGGQSGQIEQNGQFTLVGKTVKFFPKTTPPRYTHLTPKKCESGCYGNNFVINFSAFVVQNYWQNQIPRL